MRHSTKVLFAIPAFFLATTAGAATFSMEHAVLNSHYDNFNAQCDYTTSFYRTTNCNGEFSLSLPDVAFTETHTLESIKVGVALSSAYRFAGSGRDDDWRADQNLGTAFDDYRIDATFSHSSRVDFLLASALGSMFHYAKVYDFSARCQSDNSGSLIGLGDGECATSRTVRTSVQTDLGVYSGHFLDILMLQDPVLKYQRSAQTFVGNEDDDILESINYLNSSFSLNLTYTYVDKPVVSPPDVTAAPVVPLPAGLPLLATSLMALGVLRRRKTGSRAVRS